MRYPEAPRLDLVEDLHGHPVADPYRWLEEDADPRTQAWSQAQDILAGELLSTLPLRRNFAGRLEELVHAGAVGVPVWRGGRAFSTRRGPGQARSSALTRSTSDIATSVASVIAAPPARRLAALPRAAG